MPAPSKKLNIAMIGAGFIAKAHSNAFHQVNHFFRTPYELALGVICGRNPQKLQEAATQWGWQETSTDWRSVVERKDIDVVDIATPNVLHAPIALAAAQAGKIIFCEKPLAMSLREAEDMAQATANRPTLVWFNYRRAPAVVFAKQLVDEGRIGQPYHYRAVYLNQSGSDPAKASGWRYRRSEAGSGALGDLMAHSLDTALYLNGPLLRLCAMSHTFAAARDVDDAVLLLAHFQNGSIGSFEATRYGVGYRNRHAFDLHGARGRLHFDLEDMNRLEYFDATDPPSLQAARNLLVTGRDHPYSDIFWKPGHLIGYEHTFIATLGDFLLALSRGERFHPDFYDAVAVQKLLEVIAASARSGSWMTVA